MSKKNVPDRSPLSTPDRASRMSRLHRLLDVARAVALQSAVEHAEAALAGRVDGIEHRAEYVSAYLLATVKELVQELHADALPQSAVDAEAVLAVFDEPTIETAEVEEDVEIGELDEPPATVPIGRVTPTEEITAFVPSSRRWRLALHEPRGTRSLQVDVGVGEDPRILASLLFKVAPGDPSLECEEVES